MAKFDYGGGCPCGVSRVCDCKYNYNEDNSMKPDTPDTPDTDEALFANLKEALRAAEGYYRQLRKRGYSVKERHLYDDSSKVISIPNSVTIYASKEIRIG